MNRLIKGILYITAGCVGIGGAAMILGFVLGGGWQTWEEDDMIRRAKNAVRDIVVSAEQRVRHRETADLAIEDVDNGYGEASLYEGAYDDDGNYAYESDDSYGLAEVYMENKEEDFCGDVGLLTVDAEQIQNLDITLRHGCLAVEESDDNMIRVSISDSFDGLTADCESGDIIIRDERTGNHSREDAYVYLEIPDDMWFQDVKIKINAGFMEMDCGFEAHNLTVDADAGEIYLTEVSSDALSASVGAGTISIDDSEFEIVKLNCGVGTMDIEADIRGNTQIDCGMGTVDMELADGADSVNYVLNCGAGCIEIGDNTYSGLSKKRRIENGASATFALKCGMGEICIE